MRALVVDDSRATRSILRRILGQLDYDVVEAADGREALAVLATTAADPAGETIELALVDWNMPVMDGIELVRQVRSDPRYAKLVIVMVTTEGSTDHLVTALGAGADEYVMKPFTTSVIREKLELLGAVPGRT